MMTTNEVTTLDDGALTPEQERSIIRHLEVLSENLEASALTPGRDYLTVSSANVMDVLNDLGLLSKSYDAMKATIRTHERTIELLIAAGHLKAETVEAARNMARNMK